MIDEAEALRLAEDHFPNGPEVIAERLGAEIRLKPINVDGWCLRKPKGGAVVTLNENAPVTRGRFTLAHEVAHLLLGTQSDVQGRVKDIYDPRSPDEKAANRLGAELLLPPPCLNRIMNRPIDSRAILKAAKAANVSEVVVALRLFKMAKEFDLNHPVVARLEESVVKWRMPLAYRLDDNVAQRLYNTAQAAGGTMREEDKGGHPLLICALSNPGFPILFFYWLNDQQAEGLTPWEQRKQLEEKLFEGDREFRIMINAFIGAFKPRMVNMTVGEAFRAFYERYGERLQEDQGDKLHSETCRQYVQLRLCEYAKAE